MEPGWNNAVSLCDICFDIVGFNGASNSSKLHRESQISFALLSHIASMNFKVLFDSVGVYRHIALYITAGPCTVNFL